MTGPPQLHDGHARRLIDRWGEECELTTYSPGGYDAQGDPTFTPSTTAVTAYIEDAEQPSPVNTDRGTRTVREVEVVLKDTVGLTAQTGNGPSRPPQLERTGINGLTYVLRAVWAENNGLVVAYGRVSD